MKRFDLNIEKVLEHWTVPHALREIIANALDEAALSSTKEPEIYMDKEKKWHIRDFGRGLKYEHFTQNENAEKNKNPEKVIGKFGVGLKDALATFDRRKIGVTIKSKFSDITIGKLSKSDFNDVVTLHAIVNEPSDPNMVGTEFILERLKENDMSVAKSFFLMYSDENIIEETKYGSLIENKKKKSARIYVNGLCVAEEENFLFSYNITSPTKKLRQALNRERTNVSKSAYSDRVKSILLECSGSVFAEKIVKDLEKVQIGNAHDELQWVDIQIHACKILNSKEKIVFLTSFDLMYYGKYVSYAKDQGYRIVTIPDTLAGKLPSIKDVNGNEIMNLDNYVAEFNQNFEFKFVDLNDLNKKEQEIFSYKDLIVKWFPKPRNKVKEILISETMRPNGFLGEDSLGLWEPQNQRVIIKRNQLKDIESFAGTLVHELIHAYSDTDDQTLEFEDELTNMLGKLSKFVIEKSKTKKSAAVN